MCPYLWRFIPCFIFLINFCLVIYLKDTQFNIFCVSQFSVHFRTQCHSFIKPCLKAFPRLRLRMFWFIVWLPACSGRFTWNISFGKNMFLLYFSRNTLTETWDCRQHDNKFEIYRFRIFWKKLLIYMCTIFYIIITWWDYFLKFFHRGLYKNFY